MTGISSEHMDRSWLVQRLKKPYPGQRSASNPFAFGGGLRDGGLTPEALELFKDLFRFDYMGAAEFEFGEVPKTFQKIANASGNPGLVGGSFTIQLSDIQPDWAELPKGARVTTKKHWKKPGEATVWFLCPKGWEAEVTERVRSWAIERHNPNLKVATNLASTLRPFHEWDTDGSQALGWLELDNGFMFFADEEMWRGTCELFEAEVSND